jgi:hypothetical protein
MADLDVDRARGLGVAVPPTSRDEYLEAAAQLQPGYTATADATDNSIGWTVQHRDAGRAEGDNADDVTRRNFVESLDDLPGQVYLPEQLPDPALAIQAGFPPQRIPEHLIVDDENHIQGPEPSERAIAKQRAAIRAEVLARREAVAGEDQFFGSVMEGEPAKAEATPVDNKKSAPANETVAPTTPAS